MDITNHYALLQNQYIQQRKTNITIFVKICSPQNLKRDDDCETIIIINLLIKNNNIIISTYNYIIMSKLNTRWKH